MQYKENAFVGYCQKLDDDMKYASIGCGRIAVNHIKAAVNNKLQLVALCDLSLEKIEKLLDKTSVANADIAFIAKHDDYKKVMADHLY